MNRLAVLSNAASRANRAGGLASLALDGLELVTHVVTHTVDDVPQALDTLLAAEPDAVAVNGGDGTIQTLLTACLRRRDVALLPPLAVLPGGTTNMNARDLGGGGERRQALHDFLALRELPRRHWLLRHRPVLHIEVQGAEVYAGLFFGIGVVVRGVEFWQRSLRRGPLAVELGLGAAIARSAWGLVRRQPPFDVATTITMQLGTEPERQLEVSCLIVSALDELILGFRPFWGPGAGPLACTWMDARPEQFLRHLSALRRGDEARLAGLDGYHSQRTPSLTLDVAEPWLLDGEVVDAPGRLDIRASAPLAFIDLAGSAP